MGARRRHSAQFKLQAVRLMRERLAEGATLQRVAEELDLKPDMLRYWRQIIDSAPAGMPADQIFPGAGHDRSYLVQPGVTEPDGPESPEAELTRLRRENERLRQERDFLKKAAAFFAKESH